jgi:nitrogen fixation protein FixH
VTRQVQATEKKLTGRVVFVAVTTFFLAIMGVNLTMIALAIRTLPGTDVESAYRASLAYGDEIRSAREQAARHWQVSAQVTRQGDGAEVAIEARDNNGATIADTEFVGRLERPADKRNDQNLEIVSSGNGSFRGSASHVASGQWDLVIEGVQMGHRVFASRNRIVLN